MATYEWLIDTEDIKLLCEYFRAQLEDMAHYSIDSKQREQAEKIVESLGLRSSKFWGTVHECAMCRSHYARTGFYLLVKPFEGQD